MTASHSPVNTICSLVREQKGLPLSVSRAMGLDVAAKMLGGNKKTGEVLDITDRAVAHKAAGARGIADHELVTTAEALEALAARINGHAAKLRALVTP